MSIAALAWVFKQDIRPSTLKFVLAALADCANEKDEMRCWPSVKHICSITSQNIKTVEKSIAELIRRGFLIETAERKGRTKQVKVYMLNIERANTTKNGDLPREETPPKTDVLNSTKNGGVKHPQTYRKTPPNSGYGTLTDPLIKPPTPLKGGNSRFSKRERNTNPRALGSNPRGAGGQARGLPWDRRVSGFYRNGVWLNEWGPKPGDPCCLAPNEIINAIREKIQ